MIILESGFVRGVEPFGDVFTRGLPSDIVALRIFGEIPV
jgi:hypothetical protein